MPYHYTHNNPINLVDPTGMSSQAVHQSKYSADWHEQKRQEFVKEQREKEKKANEESEEPTPQELSDVYGESFRETVYLDLKELFDDFRGTALDLVELFHGYVENIDYEQELYPEPGSYPWALMTVGAKVSFYDDPYPVGGPLFGRKTLDGGLRNYNDWDVSGQDYFSGRGYIINPGIYNASNPVGAKKSKTTTPMQLKGPAGGTASAYIVFRAYPVF